MPLDTLVFVYGTLKRGFLNYEDYLKPAVAFGKAEFLGTGVTAQPAFCLVLRKERQVPCLYRPTQDETGYRVPGEVFRVDEDALKALDILEGVDEASYYREEIDIELTSDGKLDGFTTGKVIKCHIYLKVFSDKLVALPNVPEYTAEHHVAYKSRYRTPKLRILECVYGSDVTNQVQAKMDAGEAFETAWRAVAG
ncbi:hypothetical protein Poli38472_006817 [Pythium oligandrum]|uniref:Gamma-glutamylcyclotransferase family protein n=1 Tax=Pythium oligandrum TaxID=41045 RepID=A0A8K1FEM6_PYTOL|nr:hypothetical protein Poli38472_006817 [Pythium oligandrum]|eukprot:TMW56807.1 hypothetical protein Poli38472_006817 [Pythium oligandrum]